MCGETLARIEAGGPSARKRIGRNQGPGGVLGAIDTVAVAGDRPDSGPTLSRNCKAEQEFGIAAAFAGVTIPDGERGFAGRPNEATQIADRI